MDHQLVAAIQQAALQQQICNAMGMQLPFPQSMPMNFVGGGYGYGCPEGMPSYPLFDKEEVDEDDEDDEEQVRTLFCSNLDERVTEEILYEVFLQAGPIESARIPLDNTGRQRNFGFVTYQHKIAVPYAMELYQGLELFQKKLIIRPQCPEKPKPSAMGQGGTHNLFSQDFQSPAPPMNDHTGQRHVRHSIQDGMQYAGPQKKYNSDARRRSDSAVIDRNRPRHQHQQHQQRNNSGGNRRSDQRYNNGRRLL